MKIKTADPLAFRNAMIRSLRCRLGSMEAQATDSCGREHSPWPPPPPPPPVAADLPPGAYLIHAVITFSGGNCPPGYEQTQCTWLDEPETYPLSIASPDTPPGCDQLRVVTIVGGPYADEDACCAANPGVCP